MHRVLHSAALGGLLLTAFAAPRIACAQLDGNTNGLNDTWEAIHGWNLDPAVDSDHDGFSNFEEAIAGTDPHDPASFPRSALATPLSDSRIALHVPTLAGLRYQVEASADFSAWHAIGAPITGDGLTRSLEIDLTNTFASGGFRRAAWTGLTGSGVALIKNYVAAGTPAPTLVDELFTLETPQTNPDLDQYGQHLRGWLLPPETGWYTLHIASDDQSELWVGSGSDPTTRTLVASVPSWTAFRAWDWYPEQTSTPLWLEAGRSYFAEAFQRESWGGDHLSVAWTRPGRAGLPPEVIAAPFISATGLSLSDFGEGRSLSFRIRVDQPDSDGDGVSDYEEALIGLDPLRTNTTPRQPDAEAARRTLASPSSVTIGATTPRAYEAPVTPGRFTVFRAGGIEPLTVHYTVSGTASEGADFMPLSGSVTLPPGARQRDILITPLTDALVEPPESVVVTVLSNATYTLGSPFQSTVTLDDAPDVLYVAQLRPAPSSASAASGIASLRRAGNGLSSVFTLSFGALASAPTGTVVYVSTNGIGGTDLWSQPPGPIAALSWDLTAPGWSAADLIAALDRHELWVRIASSNEPGGELRGQLVATPGWQSMPPPPPAPAAPAQPAGAGDAARFLNQATFGASWPAVTALVDRTYAAWIDEQIALPPTYHRPYVDARRAELLARDGNDGWQSTRQMAWWQHALTAPDQLRQRMAWALSQIMVVSQFGALDGEHVGTTVYYDLLLEHAFGNYRDLIEDVTLSPMMGIYLSMMRNQKPNPDTGHEPDENYAREIMQLFSIGLSMLHPDGTLRLDEEGRPIPTYTQADTVGLAHIFTGWSAHYDPLNPPTWSNGTVADPDGWFFWGWDSLRPMSFYGAYHDTEDRTIAGGTVIPAGTNGVERLRLALDALFHHPNVGPFIARQLIQRFVTSNPSPGYVHRVASAFNDNGSGVRGDLAATLRAVLLDGEARGDSAYATISGGKPIEPIMRLTRMLRAFPPDAPFAAQGDPRLFLEFQWALPEQAPLYASSVFNFYQPVYRQPGPIAQAGLYAPEFQIFAETTAIREANIHYGIIFWGIGTPEPLTPTNNVVLRLNLDEPVAILDTPGLTPAQAQAALLDWLDALILSGRMSPALRADLEGLLASLPAWWNTSRYYQEQRIRILLYLIHNAPEFLVPR